MGSGEGHSIVEYQIYWSKFMAVVLFIIENLIKPHIFTLGQLSVLVLQLQGLLQIYFVYVTVVAMFVNELKRNEQSLQRTFHRCFLPSFISFGQAVSEEKLFQKSTNKKQEFPMTAIFVNGSKWNEQFPQRTFHRCFLPRFGPFSQAFSEQKIFRNRPIRNKNCLWWPCLLMDRD